MPLQFNRQETPVIFESLDKLVKNHDVKIWSVPINIYAAKYVLSRLRKKHQPWFVTMTPIAEFSASLTQKNTIRLSAIISSDIHIRIFDNYLKTLNLFVDDTDKFVELKQNELSLSAVINEYVASDQQGVYHRKDPIFNQIKRQYPPLLSKTLSIMLEVLRNNPTLIRTNLKQ